MRNILTKASVEQRRVNKHFIKKTGAEFRSAHRPQGRPKGTYKVTDAELIERLSTVASDTSRVHPKLQTPIQTLERSKRRSTTVVGLKKSQLCLRLQRCRLGFVAATTQRGKCDACYCWRNGGLKKLKHNVEERSASLKALHAPYFVCWDRILETQFDEERVEYSLSLCENPEYIPALITYLYDHAVDNREAMAHFPEDVKENIRREELAFIEMLQLSEEDVKNINWHLALKVSVDALWKQCFHAPSETTCYGLWDHMVSRLN